MKAFIDTPLLVYLNTLTDERERAVYEDYYISILGRYKPYTDVLVLDELIHVSRRKYRVGYQETIEFIDSIVLPYVTILALGEEEYKTSRNIMLKYGLRPSDALHVAAMLGNNIKIIVSEDGDYDRVDGIRRVWMRGTVVEK